MTSRMCSPPPPRSAAAGERRTEVERKVTLISRIVGPPPLVKDFAQEAAPYRSALTDERMSRDRVLRPGVWGDGLPSIGGIPEGCDPRRARPLRLKRRA